MFRTMILLIACLTVTAFASAAIADGPTITIDKNDDAGTLSINIDEKEALVYRFGSQEDLTHFYPINSPAGRSMTVQKTDPYPHHRSLWFADKVQRGDERAVTFYSALYSSKEVHHAHKPPYTDHVRSVSINVEKCEGDTLAYTEKLVWEMDDDSPVIDETRKVRIKALSDGEYFMDVTFTVTPATDKTVKFVSDAVHYAWPYFRINTDFNVAAGGAIITNSEGGINQEGTNMKPADWVDYSCTADEKNAGMAVFSHSDNPKPHGWLTRDYGTFGPRRIDAKSGKPFTIEKGQTLSRRIGMLIHEGDVDSGKVAERYQAYLDGTL